MESVLLERLSEDEYRIHILKTHLDTIASHCNTDFFNLKILDEVVCDTWGFSSIFYADYRNQRQVFKDVEQAKAFAVMLRRLVLAYVSTSILESTPNKGLIDF